MISSDVELRRIPWDADADRSCRRYLVLHNGDFPGQVIQHTNRREYQWNAARWGSGGAVCRFATQSEAVRWVITGRYDEDVAA